MSEHSEVEQTTRHVFLNLCKNLGKVEEKVRKVEVIYVFSKEKNNIQVQIWKWELVAGYIRTMILKFRSSDNMNAEIDSPSRSLITSQDPIILFKT